ncbi:MAG TPA: hypothetical protein VF269_02770 [Rhodanobacteraceae bacterium]
MENSVLALFVPFAAPGEPWVVRRARTVIETFSSREEAVMGAFGLASDLSSRMGTDVRIEVQEPDGGWRALSPVHARKSARSYASLHRETAAGASRSGGQSA